MLTGKLIPFYNALDNYFFFKISWPLVCINIASPLNFGVLCLSKRSLVLSLLKLSKIDWPEIPAKSEKRKAKSEERRAKSELPRE